MFEGNVVKRMVIIWSLVLGSVLCSPVDEFQRTVNNGVGAAGFLREEDISNIVPGRPAESDELTSQYSTSTDDEWSNLLTRNSDNTYFKSFNKHLNSGATGKDLTFCIYDDDMRQAAVALFRLFNNTAGETFEEVRSWAERNVNPEMYWYALRLESIHGSKTNDSDIFPPFMLNPHYFVNGESIAKASLAFENVLTNNIDPTGKIKEKIVINSNYSGWNLRKNGKEDLLNYFREDVSLNSYYLGIHIIHPFWMSDEELENLIPKFAEFYYYTHQQLMARYNLEKLHIKAKNSSYTLENWDYTPYLRYKNGLPFPARSCEVGDWKEEEAYMRTVDNAIRKYIARSSNETPKRDITDDGYINEFAKFVRSKLDAAKFAKIARSVVGYGRNIYPINEYNPAPSILHHPETSLRDPAYWFMIQHMLKYFNDFKNTLEPFDITPYETDEYTIVDVHVTRITTKFDFYRFLIINAMSNRIQSPKDWLAFLEVKQRRLKTDNFTINVKVDSIVSKNVIVRLYLGPECDSNNCWNKYDDFIELDSFPYVLEEGANVITWSPFFSDRLSFDNYYNTLELPNMPRRKYSIWRFPANLLIPRGIKEGLNLTLFAMITNDYDYDKDSDPPNPYRIKSKEFKILGFPFHRQAKGFREAAFNYKFINISVFHEAQAVSNNGNDYFSSHLY